VCQGGGKHVCQGGGKCVCQGGGKHEVCRAGTALTEVLQQAPVHTGPHSLHP
jgi:hypothetical protein